jgi:GNAT superfamily N-acetyltransferase
MTPEQWEGWRREAEREAEDAEYEIESATDDMRDAEDDETREEARTRLVAAADARAVARAREAAFRDLIENDQDPAEPEGGSGDEESDRPPRNTSKGYDPLPQDVVAAHARSLAAVDEESKRGVASTSHPRVSISEDWTGRTVGTGSLPDGVPVEELSYAFAPPEGFTATVVAVSDKSISMTFQDADGKDVGKLVREFRPDGEVHHSLFVLDQDARGAGFADQVLAQSLVRYEKLGVKKVTVDAAWVGRYKWATLGFRFDDKDSSAGYDRAEVEKQVERFLFANVASEETQQQVRGLLNEPWKLARLTDGNEYEVEFQSGPDRSDRSTGRFHLGKALLLQDKMPTWTGVLDVDRNNEGYLHALSKLKVEAL